MILNLIESWEFSISGEAGWKWTLYILIGFCRILFSLGSSIMLFGLSIFELIAGLTEETTGAILFLIAIFLIKHIIANVAPIKTTQIETPMDIIATLVPL